MARRSRRSAPDPKDYLPEEDDRVDEAEEDDEDRPRRRSRRSRDEDDDEPPRRRRRGRDDDDDDDDEDEERPRRKRRSRDDDEDDDEPPRRRRRGRDDDDDDEDDDRPRRKRRSRDDDNDDEDDDRPRRSRRRSRDDDEDDRPRRSRRSRDDDDDDDDDEDDRPRRSKKGGKKSKRGSNRNTGWGGYHTVKSKTSNYADKLLIGKIKGEVLVKFLDDAPFDSYGLHWYDEMSGKKGWICLESVDEDRCPGCDEGDRSSPQTLFNVIVFDDDGDPSVKVLQAGTRLAGQLESLSDQKGGLTAHYWSVSAGPKGSGTGNFQRVKERDLEDDWSIEPLDDDELAELEEDRHTLADVESIPSYKDFRAALRSLE